MLTKETLINTKRIKHGLRLGQDISSWAMWILLTTEHFVADIMRVKTADYKYGLLLHKENTDKTAVKN